MGFDKTWNFADFVQIIEPNFITNLNFWKSTKPIDVAFDF